MLWSNSSACRRACTQMLSTFDTLSVGQGHKQDKVIVYFLTCACVDFYSLALPAAAGDAQLDLTALHGKMKQSQREAKLASFAANPSGEPPFPINSTSLEETPCHAEGVVSKRPFRQCGAPDGIAYCKIQLLVPIFMAFKRGKCLPAAFSISLALALHLEVRLVPWGPVEPQNPAL